MLTTIGLIIDVIIIALLVILGIVGFKRGFLKSLISLFSWSVCIAIAFFLAKYVAGWINGIYNFSGMIGGNIASSLRSNNEFFTHAVNEFSSKEDIIAHIPSNLNGVLAQLIKVVFSNANVNMESTETIATIVGLSLGQIIMVIIAGILTFIVLKIVLAILSRVFDNIARTKFIGTLNKILGFVFGALKAAIIVIVFNVILVALSLIPAVNNTITPLVQDNTHIEKVVYNKTDEVVEKYIINGNVIQTWISDMWSSRG